MKVISGTTAPPADAAEDGLTPGAGCAIVVMWRAVGRSTPIKTVTSPPDESTCNCQPK
jgi:hypothetical protein